MTKNKAIRMAFWKYDLFPYIVCGEVDEKHSTEGKLYIPSYQGVVSNPLFVLSIVEGRKLESTLDKLKADKRKEDKALQEKYVNLLNDALGEYGLRSRT